MNATLRIAVSLLLFAAPLALRAQVGHEPSKSPYVDLEFKQELTAFTGWFAAGSDPAGVAPRSGPLLGARYEVRVGGPAQFVGRFARVYSERRYATPSNPAATRFTAPQPWPLYLMDASLSVNLTGQKSIQHFVPVVNMGFGVASDFKQADHAGYRFGTTFAFSFGSGVRWTPGGPFQVRADINDYLYQITYPTSFYVKASDNTSVLPTSQSKSVWKHNATLTVGASYLFFR